MFRVSTTKDLGAGVEALSELYVPQRLSDLKMTGTAASAF
jgi:hypothetical protein